MNRIRTHIVRVCVSLIPVCILEITAACQLWQLPSAVSSPLIPVCYATEIDNSD